MAAQLAEGEYEKFRVQQDRDYISDFDKEVKRLTGEQPGQGKDSGPTVRKRPRPTSAGRKI
ncbi:MAG: hypothetical protein ABI373_02355 [Flavobacteriales bacterium]